MIFKGITAPTISVPHSHKIALMKGNFTSPSLQDKTGTITEGKPRVTDVEAVLMVHSSDSFQFW